MSSRMCPQSLLQLQLPFPIQTGILPLRPLPVCLPNLRFCLHLHLQLQPLHLFLFWHRYRLPTPFNARATLNPLSTMGSNGPQSEICSFKKGSFPTCVTLKVCRIVSFHLRLYRIPFVELNGETAEGQEIFKNHDQ